MYFFIDFIFVKLKIRYQQIFSIGRIVAYLVIIIFERDSGIQEPTVIQSVLSLIHVEEDILRVIDPFGIEFDIPWSRQSVVQRI